MVAFSTGPALVSLPRRDADLAVRIGRPGEDELLARKVGEIASEPTHRARPDCRSMT
ncbi:hypothetical protein [Microvirga yunnanensis]|uniref:hypothetical protein n=1 Tax=Microvirga yunnanensis TaxID=2953740 RepID=UPI0021CAD942|nr:hypothetical protein [Microvirga sp. HBU65207]